MSTRAIGSLHEFGRYVNDLEYRARQTVGAEDAKALLLGWLKDIDYEKHLYDGEESEKLAAARWSNVMDFIGWIAKRCGGEIENDGIATFESEKKSVLDVAQTISVIISLAERGDDQNVVTLSTLLGMASLPFALSSAAIRSRSKWLTNPFASSSSFSSRSRSETSWKTQIAEVITPDSSRTGLAVMRSVRRS